MAWRIEFEDAAVKELAKLDKPVARRILIFLRERVAALDDPRSVGEALKVLVACSSLLARSLSPPC